MTDFQTIELNKDARGVATLWLNRADKNNAFDAQVIGELNAALAQVQDDAGIRFLILRGRGSTSPLARIWAGCASRPNSTTRRTWLTPMNSAS